MRRLLNYPLQLMLDLAEWLLCYLPGPLGRKLRRLYWRARLRHLGAGAQIDTGVCIMNPRYVSVGDQCWLDHGVIILAGPASEAGGRRVWHSPNPAYRGAPGEVHIGDRVHVAALSVLQGHGGLQIGSDLTIASGVRIYSLTHHHANPADPTDRRKYKFSTMSPAAEQSLISAPVVVGDAAAVGLNSVVLPGVQIGAGTWVGAGSVVNRSLPANVMAAGNPARVLRDPLTPGWSPKGKKGA
jgi:acetyltransferase-like isoleucine patch superfamily enzyme